jgi:hypothetical protein
VLRRRSSATLALAALLLLAPASGARAAIAPTTTLDGPSSAILGLDGVAMADDGTGGLVYRRIVGGHPHVFVARYAGGRWQTPQRVDVGLDFDSTFPAIGAADGGRLVVTFEHQFGQGVQNRMYSTVLDAGASRFQPPVAFDLDLRDGLDAAPSLSMGPSGVAYLAYRVIYTRQDPSLPPGYVDADIRLARLTGTYWSVLGQPVDRNPDGPMRTPTATNGPLVGTDANGNAVVAWQEPDDDLVDRLWVRRVFGQTLGTVLPASPATDPGAPGRPLRAGVDQAALDVSPFGEAAIAFRQLPAASSSFTRPRAYLTMLPSTLSNGAGTLIAPRPVDTGGADGPSAPLGPVSVAVDDQGGVDAAVGVGAQALVTGGTETALGAARRLDDGGSVVGAGPVIDRGRDGALAAAWRIGTPSGSGGVGLAEVPADGSPSSAALSTRAGGAISALDLAGSGLGDALVGFQQASRSGPAIGAGVIDAAPEAFDVATPPGWVRTKETTVSWDAAPAAIGRVKYDVLVDGDAIAKGILRTSQRIDRARVGDGDHDVQVIAEDTAGQRTQAPVASLKLDRTPPRAQVVVDRVAHRVSVRFTDGVPGEESGVSSSKTSVTWGDGKRTKGVRLLTHRYGRRGRFRIRIASADRVGNKLALTRTVAP